MARVTISKEPKRFTLSAPDIGSFEILLFHPTLEDLLSLPESFPDRVRHWLTKVHGWDGIEDEASGKPLQYTRDTFAKLIGQHRQLYGQWLDVMVGLYFPEIDSKNSSKLPATSGEGEAAPATEQSA